MHHWLAQPVYELLVGDLQLVNLLPSAPLIGTPSVYFTEAPQAAVLPYIVYSISSGNTRNGITADADIDSDIVEFMVVASGATADRVSEIIDRLRYVMRTGTIVLSGKHHVGTVCLSHGRLDMATNEEVWSYPMLYRIFYQHTTSTGT